MVDMASQYYWNEFFRGYLRPDAEWLLETDEGFSYWPARFRQRLTLKDSGGWLKLRLNMDLVRDVQDEGLAEALCLELNSYAYASCFVYEREDRTVRILAAVGSETQDTIAWVRFAQSCIFSAWFAEMVSDGIAKAVGGSLAFDAHPDRGERADADTLLYLPTAMRERPEAVIDPLPAAYNARQQAMLDFPIFEYMGYAAGFDRHPFLGSAWRVEMSFPQVERLDAPRFASEASRDRFDDEHFGLTGGFVLEDGLIFRDWTATYELRRQESQDSFRGHGWDTLEYCARYALRDWPGKEWDITRYQGSKADRFEEAAELASHIVWPTWVGGWPLQELWAAGDDGADRRYLWWPLQEIFLVQGWFNPMGPTFSTVESRIDPHTGDPHVLLLQRHPTVPTFLDLGTYESPEQFAERLAAGVSAACRGMLPNMVRVDLAPEELQASVIELLKQQWDHIVLEEHDDSYADTAEQIRNTIGSPWAYAGDHSEATDPALVAQYPETPDDATFDDWFALAGDALNVHANIQCLPSAWDGALNFQESHGNLRRDIFDIGPYWVTYTAVGMVDTERAADE